MDTETLLLEFMAEVNDILKADLAPTDKLTAIRAAKYRAEKRYAALSEALAELDEQP